MANNCKFYLKAVAKDKDALERLYKIMKYEDPEFFIHRVFSASPLKLEDLADETGGSIEDVAESFYWMDADNCPEANVEDSILALDCARDGDDLYCLYIVGEVAWSLEEWFDGHDAPDQILKGGTAHFTSLNVIAKALGVGVEAWGHEEFYTFQEHYLMNAQGETVIEESRNWNGCTDAELYDLKMFTEGMSDEEKAEFDPRLEDPDFDWEAIAFGDDYCSFRSDSKILEAVAAESNGEA